MSSGHEGVLASVQGNSFTADRKLDGYRFVLGDDFPAFVDGLRPDQHWIDAGAGDALAAHEYLQLRGPLAAKVTAIAMHTPPALSGAMPTMVIGTPVEDLAPSDVAPGDLVTDVFGPLQYSLRLDRVLDAYLGFLRPGGRLWVASPVTTYVLVGGVEIDVAEWLLGVPGFTVVRRPDGRSHHRDLVLQRTVDAGTRAPPLTLERAFDGPPPFRVFREAKASGYWDL